MDGDFLETLAEKGQQLARLEKQETRVNLSGPLSDALNAFSGPFQLLKYEIDPDAQKISLYADRQGDSLRAAISNVPLRVLDFESCGHNPLHEWLKLHTWPYTRTDFERDQFVELLQLVQKIDCQFGIIEQIDALLEPVLMNEAHWFHRPNRP